MAQCPRPRISPKSSTPSRSTAHQLLPPETFVPKQQLVNGFTQSPLRSNVTSINCFTQRPTVAALCNAHPLLYPEAFGPQSAAGTEACSAYFSQMPLRWKTLSLPAEMHSHLRWQRAHSEPQFPRGARGIAVMASWKPSVTWNKVHAPSRAVYSNVLQNSRCAYCTAV